MATWVAHLRIAENLTSLIEPLDKEYFVIGSIAPDYNIPESVKENLEGVPKDSHFRASSENAKEIGDLVFFRKYMGSLNHLDGDLMRFSFLLGYFIHLVTDNLWDIEIGVPTKSRFKSEFEKDPKFIWEVKRDWYGIDFSYIHENRDSIYWQLFEKCRYAHDYLDFMPQAAIVENIKRIREFYRNKNKVLENWIGERPDKYLSEQEMDRFVEMATKALHRIYKYLHTHNVDEPELLSILQVQINGDDQA